MTDINGHLTLGIVAAVVIGGALLAAGFGATIAASAAIVVVVTSLAPDIDIHSSIPRRVLGQLLMLSLPIVAIVFGLNTPAVVRPVNGFIQSLISVKQQAALVFGVVLLGGVGLVAAYASGKALDEFTTHRGFTHSLLFGGLIGAGIFWVTTTRVGLSTNQGLLLGAMAIIGVGVHLLGDQ